MRRLVLLSPVVLLTLITGSVRPATVEETTADPVAYLNRALDEMQARALRRSGVDWAQLRPAVLARAAAATSTVDTYEAIRFALHSLKDHHSSLHLTPALEALEAKRRGKRASGATERVGLDYSPYVGRYEPAGAVERLGKELFGLVVVPKCFPENERQFIQFETRLQGIIAEQDKVHPIGWIVDLRGNVGGNMWPMLAGVGPLLGESDNLGQFFNTDGHAFWRYSSGVAAQLENGKLEPYPPVEGKAYVLAGTPNVAVLVDRSTGSSGEAIAIAFRGRPQTRFFGEHTAGASTVNETFALSDGASLWLTIGVQADRTGKQYVDGLAPDEPIPVGKEIPFDNDPLIQAALAWLSHAHAR